MDFGSVLRKSIPAHQRTIVHLDMDYFYAQVEELRDPCLRVQPLGVQQKSCLVTCNYVAREFGVTKLMSIADAQRLCPTLVLTNGEDLTPYKQMSNRIHELLLNFTPLVEKLGLDENFLDVTSLVEERARLNPDQECAHGQNTARSEGHIFPNNGMTLCACDCGCALRLTLGTQIAKEIREQLHSTLGITCCAGISYNKLLAKLVGAQNKPNQQTVLVSTYSEEFMRQLCGLHRVTGIGQKTESLLLESGIANVAELQLCDMDFLRKKFGFETATKLKDLSFGRDTSAVRSTGKPKTIGLEDSCRPISVRTDVEERFRLLLMRLVEQVAEDGRIPIAVKVILRKYDAQKKTSHRESKQANILPSLFKTSACTDTGGPKVQLADGALEKLIKIIMRLFARIVELSKPFNITLLGLAFSKFQERKAGSSSIANFLIKKTDLEVQSITSLTNTGVVATSESPTPSVSSTNSDEAFRSSPTTFQSSDQFYRRRTMASPIPMLVDNGSESAATNSDFSDFSETEVEPSPKKSRIRLLMAKRRCLGTSALCNADADVASPSKLRVCDLRLNSRDSEKDFPMLPANTIAPTASTATMSTASLSSPFAAGTHRLRSTKPPSTLLNRLESAALSVGRQVAIMHSTPTMTPPSPLPSPMDELGGAPAATQILLESQHIATTIPSEFVVPPTATAIITTTSTAAPVISPIISTPTATTTATATITGNLANIPCPSGVDPLVFNELPLDVQNELIASWRSSLAAAAAAAGVGTGGGNSGGASNVVGPTSQSSSAAKAGGANGAQKNTLYRYFLRNK